MQYIPDFLNRVSKTRLLPLYIFIAVFFFSLIPQLFVPGFSSSDDPYYHVTHAHSYWNGSAIEYPAFSTLSVKPVDLWFLYHLLMSPFTAFFSGDNYEALIIGSKLYHAILAGILYTVIYFLAKAYAEKLLPAYSNKDDGEKIYLSPKVIGFLSALSLIAFSQGFSARILVLSRPHVLMLILTLFAALFIIKERYFFLLIVSALAPLSYSFSVLILIPSMGILAGWFLISRHGSDFKFSITPLAVSICGLAFGVWLHPGSDNYMFNAWVVHGYSIVAALLHNIISAEQFRGYAMPQEFAQVSGIISVGIIYSVLFGGLAAELLFSFVSRRKSAVPRAGALPAKAELIKASFSVIGIGLSFFMLFFQRAVEYAAPFLIIASVVFICLRLIPKLSAMHSKLSVREGEIGDIYRREALPIKSLVTEKRLMLFLEFLFVFVFILSPLLINVLILARERHDLYEYRGAAKYIASRKENGVTLIPEFGNYPRLIFFGANNRYSSGMDPKFMSIYDNEIDADIDRFVKNEPMCGSVDCSRKTTKDSYATLKKYGISAIFLDSNSVRGAKILEAAEKDPHFRKTFTDPKYPNINIFSL